ncbi:glycosyltransferase [Roseovarius sp. LXJ103]|uniref:glycosyltransferase n=1 Tax=Roseovarius carneus TaxID=2853164 RepID=UPI000D613E04|nr:glycosyltransferase [Roseovarius carneus]MBZ8117983.1 glycosyltransferase [Roseovarius carneus]PWE36267.1 hypothetical protein DD563_10060 [Pelagicola sp. LXJ1103]
MSTPHILVINLHHAPYSYGGATIVAEQVGRALMRHHGARISAVSLISRADLVPYGVIKSEVAGCASYLINLPGRREYALRYLNPEVAERVAQLIDSLGPDLVHVHCVQDVGAGVIEAAKARGLPVVLSVHDFWWICERQFMIAANGQYCGQSPVRLDACRGCVENMSAAQTRRDALFRQAAMADLVTYPSRFALDLCEGSGLAPGSGRVWENGVYLPDAGFAQAQAARRAGDSRLSFGFVGGPSHMKGWPDIRRAFAGLSRSDFNVELVDGGLHTPWWKEADMKGLPGTWRIHPRFEQEEMDAFYARIDVLLFMSKWKETFGLVIREALARGIEVIQTDSGGATEHGAAKPGALIPIGAGPAPLRAALEAALNAGVAQRTPPSITSFKDQADAFMCLTRPLLAPTPKAQAARHGSWGSAA